MRLTPKHERGQKSWLSTSFCKANFMHILQPKPQAKDLPCHVRRKQLQVRWSDEVSHGKQPTQVKSWPPKQSFCIGSAGYSPLSAPTFTKTHFNTALIEKIACAFGARMLHNPSILLMSENHGLISLLEEVLYFVIQELRAMIGKQHCKAFVSILTSLKINCT